MFLVYYISVSTIGGFVTDWTNDGLFGDGFHPLGIGTSDYDDAMTEYAIENVWTEDVVSAVDAAVKADVIGAEDIQEAIGEADFGVLKRRMEAMAILLQKKALIFRKRLMRLLKQMKLRQQRTSVSGGEVFLFSFRMVWIK